MKSLSLFYIKISKIVKNQEFFDIYKYKKILKEEIYEKSENDINRNHHCCHSHCN